MNTDKTATKAKRGRPYKNPHNILPPGVTIINRDELKQLREEIANLKAQTELNPMDTDTHQHPYKELKLMALDVLKQLGKPKSFNLVLLSLMEQQLHAAYILGRTDADCDAGRVLTDI